jgi:hypothetical protein
LESQHWVKRPLGSSDKSNGLDKPQTSQMDMRSHQWVRSNDHQGPRTGQMALSSHGWVKWPCEATSGSNSHQGPPVGEMTLGSHQWVKQMDPRGHKWPRWTPKATNGLQVGHKITGLVKWPPGSMDGLTGF